MKKNLRKMLIWRSQFANKHQSIVPVGKKLAKYTLLTTCCTALTMTSPGFMQKIIAQPSIDPVLTDNSPTFDPGAFKASADATFGSSVKGYSVSVARNGVLVGTTAGGIAVDGDDAAFPVPVDTSTAFNAGSTTKMATAVALLSFFEKDPSASVDEWLDREIIDYLPVLWRESLLSSGDPRKIAVGQVTFRHLLQHKSGLVTGRSFIRDGVNPAAIGNIRDYSNDNFGILTFIIPNIVDPDFAAVVEEKAISEGINEASWGDFYDQELGTYFGRYMQREFYNRVAIQAGDGIELAPGLWKERLVPSCDHKTTYAGTPYIRNQAWGRRGDKPFIGDMNGDGKQDFVVYRASNGMGYALSASGDIIKRNLPWGDADDQRLVGDVDGDGKDDWVSVSPDGIWKAIDEQGNVILENVHWGTPGDQYFLGDVDGDGKTDLNARRINDTGEAIWFSAKATGEAIARNVEFGDQNDIAQMGDFNGDGKSDYFTWNKDDQKFSVREVNGNLLSQGQKWGAPNDQPVIGDLNGDGADEVAMYRTSTDRWFGITADNSNTVLFKNVAWGSNEVDGVSSVTPLLGDLNGDAKAHLIAYSGGKWSAAGRRYALGYPSKDSNGAGDPAENVPERKGCHAQGGNWYSSAEFVAWLTEFGFGNTLVSQAVRDMMFDPDAMGERLGWSSVFDSNQSADFSFVSDEFGQRYLPYHDGENRKFYSVAIRLPNGYYAFATMNSPRDTRQIARDLVRAWIAGMGEG